MASSICATVLRKKPSYLAPFETRSAAAVRAELPQRKRGGGRPATPPGIDNPPWLGDNLK